MHLICAPTFCITFVCHFSWVLQPSQEKLKTILMQNVEGAGGGGGGKGVRGGAGGGGRGGGIRCITRDEQVAYSYMSFTPM